MAKWRALCLAMVIFTVNFWSWSLLGPIAMQYARELNLSSIEISLLLAAPILMGSLLRIPLGTLSDRYGGRRMFASVCLIGAIPTAALALADSYPELVLAAICLGITGASFSIGVPFISAWFPKKQRGTALGLYGMGSIGTAVSGLLTPETVTLFGRPATFLMVAGLLVLAGLAALHWLRDAPKWRPSSGVWVARLTSAARIRTTRDLALFYAISFGAFVAFGVYLPVLLNVSYGLTIADAAARAAGFIILATLARPVGGWLADRVGGEHVVRAAFVVIAVLAFFVSFKPDLMPIGTIAYLSLAVAIGCANGAIFALVSHWSPPKVVGSVAGIVGAAGGLGGFFPPLVMGASFQVTHSYSLAILLLMGTAMIISMYVSHRMKFAHTTS